MELFLSMHACLLKQLAHSLNFDGLKTHTFTDNVQVLC